MLRVSLLEFIMAHRIADSATVSEALDRVSCMYKGWSEAEREKREGKWEVHEENTSNLEQRYA